MIPRHAFCALKITGKIILTLVFAVAAIVCLQGAARAELLQMSNAEMAKIRGHGATNLYIEENTVRLFLDIHMETYGEIDSAKAAYYEKGGQYNWDMNWTELTLGESKDTPLVTDGLVFRAEFDDINAPDKQLKRIILGTNNMAGQISGTFTTTTGAVHPGVVGESGTEPIVMNRGADLQTYDALNISDNGFFIDINLDGKSPERGVKTIIGYPESQAINFTFSGTDWWQE
ncbi:MAG: hypothetical protein K9K82_06660 [Desulfobacteraceae bacterium]|nr:hypothetical protein [Desulfobacteraceae bacterium]